METNYTIQGTGNGEMMRKIGNGSETFLWYDNCVSNVSLLASSGLHGPPNQSINWRYQKYSRMGSGSLRSQNCNSSGMKSCRLRLTWD